MGLGKLIHKKGKGRGRCIYMRTRVKMVVTSSDVAAEPGDVLSTTVRDGRLYVYKEGAELGYVRLHRLGHLAHFAKHKARCVRSHPTKVPLIIRPSGNRLSSATTVMGNPVCWDAGVCKQCGGFEDYLGEDVYGCMTCM